MAASNYVDRKGELAKEYGFQNSYKYGDTYLDSLLEKSDDQLEGYDKAMLNVNPDLKAKRDAYQKSLAKSNQLKTDLTNIESAKQYLQNNVSQQKERINKLYDLQDKAAAISASIQGTNRVAGGLGAASNVLGNSRGITDAQMQQQILQNSAQRESALANVAQQEANLPSVLASLDQAAANSELARAQAKYYENAAKNTGTSGGGGYSSKKTTNEEEPKELTEWSGGDGYTFDGTNLKDKNGNSVYTGGLLEYQGNLYNADTGKLVYDKSNDKWYGLTVPKTNTNTTSLIGKKMPAGTIVPTLNPTLGTGNNTTFTNVGNRVSL